MSKLNVIIRPTISGRAYEKVRMRNGKYVLIADRDIHNRALGAAGVKLREAIRDVKGKAIESVGGHTKR